MSATWPPNNTRLSHVQPPSLAVSLSLTVSLCLSPRESYCTVHHNHMQEYRARSPVSPRGQLVHKTPTIRNNHERERRTCTRGGSCDVTDKGRRAPRYTPSAPRSTLWQANILSSITELPYFCLQNATSHKVEQNIN